MCDYLEDDDTNVKGRLLDILVDLSEKELHSVEQWISSQSYKSALEEKQCLKETDEQLKNIGLVIKCVVPFKAVLASEKITPPSYGDLADCKEFNSCHVDEFLYDEEDVEQLVKDGVISEHYCADCKSTNVKEMVHFSHSMSREAIEYICKVLLPKDLTGKCIVDIGSRFGGVLYGAYYLTNAASIIGVEINKDCCDLQEEIINKFALDPNRIKVINEDIRQYEDVIKNADVIIMNVLDFFNNVKEQIELWRFFRKHFKRGCYVILNRSICDTFSFLGLEEEMDDWLDTGVLCQRENEVLFDLDKCSELRLYIVK